MTEPTPINPAPTAVPWTPHMATPQNAIPAPVPAPHPVASPNPMPSPAPYQGGVPASFAPAGQPPLPNQAGVPQTYAPQPQFQQPPHLNQGQPNHAQPNPPLPAAQAPNLAPMPMPPGVPAAQAQPYQQAGQPHGYQQQQQQQQQQMNPSQYNPAGQAQPYGQATPPPMPHLQAPGTLRGQLGLGQAAMGQAALGQTGMGQSLPETPPSKSLFAKLLKRSPKPESSEAMTAETGGSESLLGKKFGLGAVAGFVAAVALMSVLDMFAAEPAQQAQSLTRPAVLTAQNSAASQGSRPVRAEGDTFLDNAIASDAP